MHVEGIIGFLVPAFILFVRGYWRAGRRLSKAPDRARDFASGREVRIPIPYEDSGGRHLETIPRTFSAEMTVLCAKGKPMRSGRGHLSMLGDFDMFWNNCLRDMASGSLETVTDADDLCIAANIPWPQGATAFVLMAKSDWEIITSTGV